MASGVYDTLYVVTNLDANTPYVFAIQANCSADDASTMARVSFRTECNAISVLPWTEGFENVPEGDAQMPYCWKKNNGGVGNYPYAYNTSPRSGNNALYFYLSTSSSYAASNQIAVMPAIDASIDMSALRLRFYGRGNAYGGGSTVRVGVINNPADTAMFVVSTMEISGANYSDEPYVVTGFPTGMGNYIAISVSEPTSNYSYVYIDDVTLDYIPSCPDITGVTVSDITAESAAISWNTAADYYVVYIDNGTVEMVFDTVYYIEGLAPTTDYTYGVAAVCGDEMGTISTVSFRTTGIPTTVPYVTSFEDGEDQGWEYANGVNAWTIGAATANSGEKSLYISNDNGVSNTYTDNTQATSYAWRTIQFEEAGDYSVSFNWKGQGEGNYDYLRVWLAPASFVFTADAYPVSGQSYQSGYTPDGWIDLGGKMNLQEEWQTSMQQINVAEAGNYNLVFMWRNDNSTGNQPAIAIDNVSVMPLSCPAVANLTATGVTASEATIAWSYNNDGAYGYEVYLNGEYINNVYDNNSYTFTNLNSEMTYTAGVRALCSDGDTSMMATTQFTTSMGCGNGTCVVTIVGHDSYGDGWNGNAINIVQNGETVGTFTLSDGSDQTTGYCVTEGQPISFSWTTGSYSYETSFQVVNAEGVTVADISDGSVLTGGETFLALDNCNSIPTDVYDTIDIVACGSYWWNKTNNEYTESGVYTVQTSNALGYSSYTTLNLTINPNYYSNDTVVAVGSYYDEANDIFATQGSWYYRSYQTVDGCDSTVGYNIIITPYATTDTQHVTACEYYNYGYGYYAYGSGIYEYDSVLGELYLYDTVYYYDTVYEYDSMMVYTWYNLEQVYNLDAKLYHFVLDLTIKNNVWSETYDTTYADYYVWNGDTLRNSSWMYSHNYPGAAANGCDSTAYLTLTILSGDVRYATACDYFNANGRWFYQSGIHYYDSTICDTVNRMYVETYEDYVYSDSTGNGQYVTRYDTSYYTERECYNRTFALDLTINHSTWRDTTVYAVDYYVFGGDTLESNGWYEHTFQVPGGCDSSVGLNLVIISGDTINVIACDWYETSDGRWYTESGLYTFDSTDADGITRTYLLDLTINHSTWRDDTVFAVDYYVFGGDTLTNSGWYEHSFPVPGGCDSNAYIRLFIISGDTINVTACDWYETSNGWWYYESGLYTFDSSDAEGNTRSYLLNLTVNHSYWFDTSVITPDYYVFGGDTLTESGWYEKTFTAVNGCDSTIGLNLDVRVIHELTVNTNGGYLYVGALGENIRSDTVLMVGQGYQFLQLVTFDPVTGGYYDVDGEHSRLYELYIDGQPVDLSESVSNDVYTLNIYNYLASSGYNIYNIDLNMYGDHSIEAVYGPYYNDSVCLSFGRMNVYDETTEGATVTWIRGSGADTYTVSYGLSDNVRYSDSNSYYYFEGDYVKETLTSTDTTITYQLSNLQSFTDYVVLVEMTCDDGELYQYAYGFTTQGLPHTITVTNNGGSAWREELDRLDTTVVFTGHEGESFFTYLYSHMPETDSMWYGRTDRCQLHNIIIDGDTIDVLQNSSSDVYDLWVNQDGDYIYYELNVYYNADHIVEYVFGPYDETEWPEYCVAPRDLHLDYATNSSVAITWEHYEDIYVVDLYTLDGEVVYHDTTFSGYYEFTDLASNTEYYAVVGTVCPNGTNRTSAINVQTYGGEMHTITLSSNGGFIATNSGEHYTSPVDLTFTGYEGQDFVVSFLSFAADGQGILSYFDLDQSKWQLKHLYFDSVDIMASYSDSASNYIFDVEHYNENALVYDAYGIYTWFNADHSIVAEFGPYDAVEHTITIINHGGGYVDDQMSGGYGFFTQDTNVITGYEGNYISLRLISMHPNRAPYLVNHDSTMLVRLVFDGEEYLFDGSDSRVFINDQGNEIYYGWGVQDIYFDADHTLEVWFEPWTREYIYDTVELTIEGEGYVYNMDEGMMVTGDTTFTVSDDSWTRLQFVTLDPVVGSNYGFEEGCRLNALIIDGEYVSLDGNINGDGYNVYTYDYLWNNGYIIYYVYLNGSHTVHAVFGPYHDSTLCTTMTRMQLSEQYNTSAVVSWVAGNGTNTYHLYYGLADNFNYDSVDFYGDYTEQVITGDQEQFVYQMNDLQPSSHYIVMLKMFCENSDGWWYTYRDLYTSGDPHSITFSNNGGYLNDQTLSGRDTTIVSNYYDGWSYGTYILTMPAEEAQNNGISEDRCHLNQIIIDSVSVDLTVADTTDDYMIVPTVFDDGWIEYYFRIYYNADHTVQFIFGPQPGVHTLHMTACGSYEWNDSVYTASGTYVNGEDTLVLTINQPTNTEHFQMACDEYWWHDTVYTTSGVYTFTGMGDNKCVNTETLYLTVNHSSVGDTVVATVCDEYVLADMWFYETGVYDLVINNTVGCDSLFVLDLTVNYSTYNEAEATACDSYEWHDSVYTESGVYTYVIPNAVGCDSIMDLFLTVNYGMNDTIVANVCDSYVWNDSVYTATGIYRSVVANEAGCYDVSVLDLTVGYSTVDTVVMTVCNSLEWNGSMLTNSDVYAFMYANADGCDSLVVLDLTVNHGNLDTVYANACDSYEWHDSVYTESGEYTYTISNGQGCENVTVLMLTVGYNHVDTISETVCNSMEWHDAMYTQSGLYPYTYDNDEGCTNTEVLNLTVNYSTADTNEIAACDIYEWYGEPYTESGVYTRNSTNNVGCSHTDVLVLTVNSSTRDTSVVTVCDNYEWNGVTYTRSGAYTYTSANNEGCDNVSVLYLTVNHSTVDSIAKTECDSYTWMGTTYTASGVYSFDTTNINGCDSIMVLNLVVNSSTTAIETVEACNSYRWHGMDYTASTDDATYTTENANGCDSTVTLHLTIDNCSTTQIAACDSYTWHGNEYTESGTYVDDNDTLVLTINRSNTASEFIVACDSYTWHGVTYTASTNEPVFVTTNVNGCDSIVSLELIVNNGGTSTSEYTVCDSYTWHGEVYTISGTYSYTTMGANGCDSTAYLNLTVNYSNSGVENVYACDSYVWNGITFTTSGSFAYNSANAAGCDSTTTINLRIGRSTSGDTLATACNSFDWYEYTGIAETQSLSHIFEGGNQYGCDSTVTLHLIINQCSTLDTTVCGSYTWHGNTYTTSGIYGDGTDTLILTVAHANSGDIFVDACNSYDWFEFTGLVESQSLTRTFTNQSGCDSVVTLHLTINHCGTDYVTACESYMWKGFNFTSSGTFVDGADTLVLTIKHANSGDTIASAFDSFDWYEYAGIDSSMTLSHTFYGGNQYGCDSTVTLHLTIKHRVIEHRMSCDSYVWNGETFTSSGTFVMGDDTLVLTIGRNSYGDTLARVVGSFDWYEYTGLSTTQEVVHTFDSANIYGCDSIVTLHLLVVPADIPQSKSSSCDTVIACDSYTWHGFTLTSSGLYPLGSDTLLLTIHRSNTGDTIADACNSFDWYEHLDITESCNKTHVFSGANVYGCDSTMTLHLSVNACSTVDTTVCGIYQWHGYNLTSSGTYVSDHDTLNLTVKRASSSDTVAVSCGSFDWYEYEGLTGDIQSVTHTFAGSNVDGCDSTVTLHLAINQCSTIDTAVCGSFQWKGFTLTSSGTYVRGTDTLMLTVNRAVTADTIAVVCDGFDWYEHTGLTESQSISHVFPGGSIYGCDSTVTLHLTVNHCSTTDTAVCESYTWKGFNLTTSGTYMVGHDTLMLTVNHSTTSVETVTACNNYVWHGHDYSAATDDATYTYTDINGCDSVVTLHLTINQCSTTEITACDQYTWHGGVYNTSGVYTDGSDTLLLTINRSSMNIINATACDSYTWHGTTYTSSTTATYTTENAVSCDSVTTLVLTVNHPVPTVTSQTVCDIYNWHTNNYTTSGDYTFAHTDANGCNQVDTLHLTVNHSVSTTEQIAACDQYELNGTVYTESAVVNYTGTTAAGCDSMATINLTINHSVAASEQLAVCDQYELNGTVYTQSATVTYNGTTAAGCDSVVTIALTINHSVSTYDTLVVGENELPTVYDGHSIAAAGDYTFDYTTSAGCDSTVYLHVVANPVGIDDVDLEVIGLYPNPTTGRVTISSDNVVKVEVMDITGRKVATFHGTNTFDIGHLAEGSYTLRITLDQGTTIRKVIKR